MTGLKAKTARGSNFTAEEKENIVKLCLKYKKAVEDKRSDSLSVSARNKTWEKITNEFNASCEKGTKTPRQLKNFYKNQKAIIKKNLAADKARCFKTGGGSYTKPLMENDSLTALVEHQMTPITNEFDSSADYFEIDDSLQFVLTNSNDEEQVEKECENVMGEGACPNNSTAANSWNASINQEVSKTQNRRTNSYLRQYVEEFSDLKKESLLSRVEKNRAKAEKARKEIKLLELQISSLKRATSE